MPFKKQAQTPAPANGQPTDDDVLISTTYVPGGAYVVIAMDESVDQQVVLFAPTSAQTIGDRRVKVIARDLDAASALRLIADRVANDMTSFPKTKSDATAVVVNRTAKKVQAAHTKAQRGGAGPVKTADPAAPWGRLADGTPKQKPGRRPTTDGNSAAPAAPTKKVAVTKKAATPAIPNGATKKAVTKTTAKKSVAGVAVAASKASKRPSVAKVATKVAKKG